MSNKLEKMRDELADEYVAHGYGCDGDTAKDSFIKGFNAADAYYRPIVEELVKALETYSEMKVNLKPWNSNATTSTQSNQYIEVGELARAALESVRSKI